LAKKAEAERKRDEGFILASSNDTNSTGFQKAKKPPKLKNEVYELQDIYMQQLDEQYSYLHNEKKAKKFQIVRSIRLIQKFWRFHHRMRKIIICNRIGSWYRDRKKQHSEIRIRFKGIKSQIAAKKIQKWFRKIRETWGLVKINKERMAFYHLNVRKIVKIQSKVRQFLVWLNWSKIVRYQSIRKQQQHINKIKKFRKSNRAIVQYQSEFCQLKAAEEVQNQYFE